MFMLPLLTGKAG